ncbi:MAG TPA: hypothetical protein VN026_04630 [Bacteroidia bacterium]|nr:hypothetical protein [Bacteroidia bacterium]
MIPNPNIYTQDESIISNDLLPVKKRTPIHKAWLKQLLSPLQWLTNLIFVDFAGGSNAPNWVFFSSYAYLDRVCYTNGSVYELQALGGEAFSIIAPNINPSWIKILDTFIGVRERARYNGQKLMLELILNRRFKVALYSQIEWEIIWIAGVPVTQAAPPYSQIYITKTANNLSGFWLSNGNGLTSYMSNGSVGAQMNFLGNTYAAVNVIQYTIHVPIALYTTIGTYQLAGVTADMAIRSIVDKYTPAGSIYTIITY